MQAEKLILFLLSLAEDTSIIADRIRAEFCLSHILRSTDLAARYGGEEFIVLLQDAEIGKLSDFADEK